MVATGKMEMINAIWRHEKNDPISNANDPPKFVQIGESANSIPRIDFSLQMTERDGMRSLMMLLIVFALFKISFIT